MKKYILSFFLIMLAAKPVSYASYVYFFPPAPVLMTAAYPAADSANPYRKAYKPYPAPRSAAAIDYYYTVESRLYLASVGKAFLNSERKIEQSIKTADNAAKDFDVLVKTLY